MSLPVIAIVISSCSAAFTLSSLLVSLATYLRGGPRLKVKAEIGPYEPYLAYRSGGRTRSKQYWHVHVVNRSSASVEVEKVVVILWLPAFKRLFYKKALALPPIMDVSRVNWLEGEEKKKLEAFGGARWVLTEKLSSLPLPDDISSLFLFVQLRVTLTNGRESYSNLVALRRIARGRKSLFEYLIARMEGGEQEPLEAYRQLSVDDLDEPEAETQAQS
ncbi:hypothetical protein ACFY2T_33755 [Streptomyces sp. NPDC001260]|uniref:hypothetical protein n=1 Tax=Streptomyces sp. NPDC001260 TaxID=3364551 RepID=UPI0036AF41F7